VGDVPGETVRLTRRPLLAGDVLRRLPDPATAADVLAQEADILALRPREREALRWALVGRLAPEDMAALRPLFGRPEPPPDPWPPADAASLVRAARRIAEACGWRPPAPWPRAVLRGLSGCLVALPEPERRRAAGVLAGACGWPSADAVLDWALRDAGADPEGMGHGGGDAALAAYEGLPAGVRRMLASARPRRQRAGAVAAVRAGMAPAAVAAVLAAAGMEPADADGVARWAARRADARVRMRAAQGVGHRA
jgi:hypothetical protein